MSWVPEACYFGADSDALLIYQYANATVSETAQTQQFVVYPWFIYGEFLVYLWLTCLYGVYIVRHRPGLDDLMTDPKRLPPPGFRGPSISASP